MKEVKVSVQLVIVGGGMAGCLAAVRAARDGIHTVLVQDRPVLGGNASKEIGVSPLGACGGHNNCYFRETGLIEELLLENLYRNPEGYLDYWDATLLDFVLSEPNLTLYLNTSVVAVEMDGTKIKRVIAIVLGAETRIAFEAEYFIDASGDGIIGALSGAPFRMGREAKNEFNEPQAPEVASKNTMGASILYWARDMGHAVPFVSPSWARRLEEKDFKGGRHPLQYFREDGDLYGLWWIECGHGLDSVYDAEKIRFECLRLTYGVWDYVKNRNSAREKLNNYALLWVSTIPGKRESRRFEGDYILTENDLREQREFPDSIAYGGWSLDDHVEGGFDDKRSGTTFFHLSGLYNIPLRCLYSRTIENLFFAGRNVSVTHRAFSSTRVIATCAQMGEAVGKAASICIKCDLTPRQLVTGPMISELQQSLLRDDHYIHGLRFQNPDDLAPLAKIEASSYLHSPSLVKGDALYVLDRPFLLMFSITSRLRLIELFVDAESNCSLPYHLYLGDEKGNYIPDKLVYSGKIDVGVGKEQWIRLPVELEVSNECWVFLMLQVVDGLKLHTTSEKLVGINSFENFPQVMLSKGEQPFDFYNEYSPWCRLNGIWTTKHQNACFRISPEQEVYSPKRLTIGYNRPFMAPNIWISQKTDFSSPEWILFSWERPIKIEEVRLIFDTDLDYFLRAMHSKNSFRTFQNCVRDYLVEAEIRNKWQKIAEVSDNYQRLQVHRINCAPVDKLKLVIQGANGADYASVYSVNIFGKFVPGGSL